MVEHIGALLVVLADIGFDVLRDGVFAEIVFHDLRHIGVDRLVVGDAGAGRVGQRHITLAIGPHDAGYTEQRFRLEDLGIDELIVDAAIDDVDALQAFGGPHIDDIVLDEEVGALRQRHTHLLGEIGVLEIGRIIDAGRQNDDVRLVTAVRRDVLQRLVEMVAIVADRADLQRMEGVGQDALEHGAVFQHVGNA